MSTDGPTAKRRKSSAAAQTAPEATQARVAPVQQLDVFGDAETEAERNGFQLDPDFVRIKGGQPVIDAQALRTSGLELWLVQLPPGQRVFPMLHNQDLNLDVEANSCSGSFCDHESGLSFIVSQESESLIPPLRVMNPKPSGKGFESLPVTRWVTLARDSAAPDSQPPVLEEGVVREWPFVVDTYITQEERDGKGAMGSKPSAAVATAAAAATAAAKGTPARATTASKESPTVEDEEAELKRQKKARKAAKAAAAAVASGSVPATPTAASAAARPAAVSKSAAVSKPEPDAGGEDGKKKKRKSEIGGGAGAVNLLASPGPAVGSVTAMTESSKADKKAKRRASSAVGGNE